MNETHPVAEFLLILQVLIELLDLGLEFSDAALEGGNFICVVLSLLL